MRVTAIERQRRHGRVNVFLDGRFALGLCQQAALVAGLRVGHEIDEAALQALHQSEVSQRALTAALRLLSYRSRSEAELRDRLCRRGTPPALVVETLSRLRQRGLVDDAAFARAWVDGRQRSGPRGKRLLARELRAKGVAQATARAALEGVDEDEAAVRAATRRAQALRGLPYGDFQRRLGGFLRRRGFGYETAQVAVRHLWQRAAGDQGGEAEP